MDTLKDPANMFTNLKFLYVSCFPNRQYLFKIFEMNTQSFKDTFMIPMKCILDRKRKMMAEKTNFAGSQVHTIERKYWMPKLM